MGDLSNLDTMLGIEPIESVEQFKSPEARELAARFGLTLAEIPLLRKKFHDHPDLERLVDSGKIPRADAARALAAEAIFRYETAARGTPFKLVFPGQTDVITKLYDNITSVNPNGARMESGFGRLYAMQAAAYSPSV